MEISNSLHANLHKDRKGSFEVDEKRKKFLYSIDSAIFIMHKKTGTNFKSAPAYLEDIYLNYL